jgi:hypothetical protein
MISLYLPEQFNFFYGGHSGIFVIFCLKRNAYSILVGKPEGNKPLARSRRRWKNNIRMDLRELGREDLDWMNLAQDKEHWWALLNTVMNLRVP